MLKDEYKIYEQKMQKSIDSVAADFASVRAGRANAGVLDRIMVDYYGSPTPSQQIAAISTPEPRALLITPWDGSALKSIEIFSNCSTEISTGECTPPPPTASYRIAPMPDMVSRLASRYVLYSS